MQTQLNIKCSESFKDDVDEHAESRGQNTSEYVREAVRRQMQRDITEDQQ